MKSHWMVYRSNGDLTTIYAECSCGWSTSRIHPALADDYGVQHAILTEVRTTADTHLAASRELDIDSSELL